MTARSFLAFSLTAATALFAHAAVAQEAANWHHPHRREESPQNAALEFRFGPYKPKVDEAFAGTGPYKTVFGNDTRYSFGIEVDWQVLRIPWVGTLGPGLSVGYTRMSSLAKIVSTGADSAESTFLSILPMYGVAVFRADALARETPVPIVPYAKLGLSYALWWTGNDLKTQARGHTWGTQYALGGMLLLDAFDPGAAMELDNEIGINHTYAFFEWMASDLDGLGLSKPVLKVGTNTWVLGLAFEM